MTQVITQQLTGGAVRTIAQRFGISETTANTAVQIAVPLMLTALARNASQPQGAESLHQAINNDHDGGIFANLMGYLGNPQSANGAGILGHVFGDQQPVVAGNLAQAAGMDQNSASGLLETIAPLVMGGAGFPNAYAVKVTLPVPSDADLEWLEFGLAQSGDVDSPTRVPVHHLMTSTMTILFILEHKQK